METVIILDHDSRSIEGYRRMMEASKEQINCKFFERPEDVVEYVKKYPVAVLISELFVPYMSGKELFDIVEMLSPSTIRIAMAQVEDVSETLEVYNKIRIFKMILKPFFFPEDLTQPIQEALECYRKAQAEERQLKKMEAELEKVNQELGRLNRELDRKKRKDAGIYHVARGIIRGSLNLEMEGINAQESSYFLEECEEMLREFMRCYKYESHHFQGYADYLMKRFHHPENGCMMKIQNKTGQKIPEEMMAGIYYGMFLGSCLCQWLFLSYSSVLMVEREGKAYLLRIFCQYPEKGDIYRVTDEKIRKLMLNIIKEAASALSDHMVMGSKNRQFAIKLYFGKEA